MLLVLALAIGGAGTRYPLLEMTVEAASVVVLFYFAATTTGGTRAAGARAWLALAGLILLIPLLQLVPLPPALWQALPGRERASEVLGLIGAADAWRPLSLDPEATRRSALAMLPGIAMLVATLHLTFEERGKLITVLIAFAVVGATLGALQIASGGGSILNPFDTGHRAHGVGLFTNRNHQANFLLIAIGLTAAMGRLGWTRDPSSHARLVAVGLIVLFAAGILATASRTGSVLLLLVLPAAVALLFPVRIRWRTLGMGLAGMAALLLFALNNEVVQAVVSRFAADDPRFAFWQDTIRAIGTYAPAGAGLGTFVPVHQAVESLESVGAAYVNHAHNDYLQLAVEIGLPALLGLLFFLILAGLAAQSHALGRVNSSQRILGASALLGILVVLLHSVVDYPLRMLSLTAVFGMLCALITSAPTAASRKATEDRTPATLMSRGRTLGRTVIAALVGMALIVQILLLGFSGQAVRSLEMTAVRSMAPWSSDAASLAAVDRLRVGDLDEASALSVRALREAPLDVRAMSTLALVYEQRGRPSEAARLMNVAATGGWRDPVTQLWIMDRAVRAGAFDVAAQRADAMLRQDLFRDQIFAALRQWTLTPAAAAALARRLGDAPAWRRAFLSIPDDLTPAQLAAHERLLAKLAATAAPATEDEAAILVRRYLTLKDYARARSAWMRLAEPRDRHGDLVIAGDFEGLVTADLRSPPVPFRWGEGGALDATVRLERPPGERSGTALEVRTRSGAAGVLLRQYLVLSPATYRLSFRVMGKDAISMTGFDWSLNCLEGGGTVPSVEVARTTGEGGWIRIVRDYRLSGACPAHELRLDATGRALGAVEAWFDQVSLTRAGGSRRSAAAASTTTDRN